MLKIYIDKVRKIAVRGFKDPTTATFADIYQGDGEGVELHYLEPTGDISAPYRYYNPAADTVSLGIGPVDAPPTGGTFTLEYDGDSTAALAFDISADALETALNALASITSAGGVSVTGDAGGPFQVAFTTVGVRLLLDGDPALLEPLSNVVIDQVQEGTVEQREIQLVKLSQNPPAYLDEWDPLPSANITVTTIIPGDAVEGDNETQLITIDPAPIGGYWSLRFGGKTTRLLAHNISPPELQTALEALSTIGAGNISVEGTAGGPYTVSFIGTLGESDRAALVPKFAGLLVPVGLKGDVGLNTIGLELLLNGAARVTTRIEVERYIGGTGLPVTDLQSDIRVVNDMLNDEQLIPTPRRTYGYLRITNNLSDLDDAPEARENLGINTGLINLVAAPANNASTGAAGDYSVSASHLYICVGTNTWLRFEGAQVFTS